MKVFVITTTADLTSKDIQDYIWMNVDGKFAMTVMEVKAEGEKLTQPNNTK